jgi:hypothetical protein
MKYLIPLLFLSACSLPNTVYTDPNTLKFHAGDAVRTSSGFYSSCMGTIRDYYPRHVKEDGPGYFVSFDCFAAGHISNVGVGERDLVKR